MRPGGLQRGKVSFQRGQEAYNAVYLAELSVRKEIRSAARLLAML